MRHALVALLLALALVGAARADDVMVPVVVNGVKQAPVVLTVDGDALYVAHQDFAAWGLTAPEGERVDLRAIPWLVAVFDEERLTLAVTVPADRLPAHAAKRIASDVPLYDGASGFANYGLLMQSGRPLALTLESGVRIAGWLLYNSGSYIGGDYRRLQVAAIHDDVPAMRRLTIGDYFSRPGVLIGSAAMTGLSVRSERSINPSRQWWPSLGLQVPAALPSEVEIFVDGRLVRRERVAPGTTSIEGIEGATGSRDVRVVVRDAFGRETVTDAGAHYFTRDVLRQGEAEYEYNVGALRLGYGTPDDRFGALAVSGMHRYGVSDRLTLGAFGTSSGRDAGIEATIATPAGVVSAAASLRSAAVAYHYSAGSFSGQLGARHVGTTASFASASYSIAELGTFSAGVARDAQGHTYSAGYSRNIGARAFLTASVSTRGGEWAAGVFVRMALDGPYSVSVNGSRSAAGIEVARSVPQSEGWGGALRVGTHGAAEAWAQLNLEHATLRARVNGEQSFAIAGGVGAVGGRVFTSRPLRDSFAVVDVGVPDVRVYTGGAESRTDAAGVAVVPLQGYRASAVRFDKGDVPFNYVIGSDAASVRPAYRSGALVTFDVRPFTDAECREVPGACNDFAESSASANPERIGERELP